MQELGKADGYTLNRDDRGGYWVNEPGKMNPEGPFVADAVKAKWPGLEAVILVNRCYHVTVDKQTGEFIIVDKDYPDKPVLVLPNRTHKGDSGRTADDIKQLATGISMVTEVVEKLTKLHEADSEKWKTVADNEIAMGKMIGEEIARLREQVDGIEEKLAEVVAWKESIVMLEMTEEESKAILARVGSAEHPDEIAEQSPAETAGSPIEATKPKKAEQKAPKAENARKSPSNGGSSGKQGQKPKKAEP